MPAVRHLVFLKLASSATPQQVDAVIKELSALPSVIPNILYYRLFPISPSLRSDPRTGGFSLLIDSIFHDAAALAVYNPHPAHQRVIATHINPIREATIAIDFVLPSAFNLDAFQQLQRPPHVRHLWLYGLKEEAKGKEAAVNAQAEQLQTQIPAIVSILVGRMDAGSLYEGYVDRSQGLVNVVEFVLRDPAAAREYHEAPAHKKLVEDWGPLVERMQVFDYEL